MRTIASFSIILFIFLQSTFSQIKVISNGNVGISTTNPQSKLAIGNDGYNYCIASLYSTSNYTRALAATQVATNASNYNYGISSCIQMNSYGWKLYGVCGQSYNSTPISGKYTYGVIGVAGNGENGLNYGVYGKIEGSRNGTGIFGCDLNNSEVYIVGNYAGYFKGNVKVDGNLYVTGSYPGSDIRLKKDVKNLDYDILSKLSQLHAIKYKLKHPSELDGTQSDTMNIENLTKELQSEKYTKDRIGLIAQELLETFPEVVVTDDAGYLHVSYDELVPI